MTDTLRIFLAVDPDAATRHAASEISRACQQSFDSDAIRWVREETYHVTLRFLGDTERGRIEALTDCVREQTAALQPFRMQLGGVRPFPSKRRPIAIVLDVDPLERFEELAEAVERGVVAAGFDPNPRRFQPHLTLGRVRGKGFSGVTASVTPTGQSCDVNEVVLFRSDLHPSGARYTPIERAPIGGKKDTPHH